VSETPFRPLSYVGAIGHEHPGYPHFPRYTVDVVSAELPCGASWLASMLLECCVPIWNPWNVDMSLEWRHLGGRDFEYHYPGDPWSRVISGLVTGRRFAFDDVIVPRFSHDVPGRWTPCGRMILFVRDPRDALFSAWRRLCGASAVQTSFEHWVSELDDVWGVPRVAAYLMRLAMWQHFAMLRGTSTLVVRFEDVKADAGREFERIRGFFGESRFSPTPGDVDRALMVSSFGTLQGIESAMLRSGVFSSRMNFAGCAYEYTHHFTGAMHSAIGSGGRAIYRWLGYVEPSVTGEPEQLSTIHPDGLRGARADLSEDVAHAISAAAAQFNEQ
jgi:hypothetical protein